MSDLYFVDKLFKVIRERRGVVVEAMTEGAVNDFARLDAWNEVEHEVRLLLKREHRDDDQPDPS